MPEARTSNFKDHQLGPDEIERYMEQRDIPDWFRGISNFQCAAAKRLSEALLFDGEQRTTHRVRDCLIALGLKPMPSREQLRTIMNMSRGSDLAFLWFLLESFYKSSKGPGYNLNEQIIYSSITHLDMVTTLRELDRLLPHNPPHEIKAAASKKPKRQIVVKPEKFKQFPLKRFSHSPYTEDIIVPTIERRPLYSKRPDQKVSLYEYEAYSDPSYIVRNEATRWFADYKPKLSKRVAGHILREMIEELLENIDEIAKDMAKKFVVCTHHRKLIEAEMKRKCDREAKARYEIEKYFDVDRMKKLRAKERILAQIERDVEMYMQKSRYDAERIHRDQRKKREKIEVLDGIDTIRYCEPKNTEGHGCKETEYRVSGITEFEDDDFGDQVIREHKFSVTLESNEHFFKANQEHKPWYFDFQKIFTIDQANLSPDQSIQLSFVKALDAQMPAAPDINGYIDIESAADTAFDRQWSESLKDYNRTVKTQVKKVDEEIPLRFDREYFDPRDQDYMVYMLRRCFDHMKKDSKFVLASLPDAHKVPVLLYFIQGRFGKRYSFEDRKVIFAESMRILRALEKLTKVVAPPKLGEFCSKSEASYACRNYILTKGEKIRQKYYEQMDKIIMYKARIFWFSMRPYLFTSGPPRNTYFAYMPPRTVDLTRFRQWQPSEFMDAKREWDRRQREASRSRRL